MAAGHDAFAELAAHADIPGKVLVRVDDHDASDTAFDMALAHQALAHQAVAHQALAQEEQR